MSEVRGSSGARVSVVVPSYGRAALLRRALESVAAQTYVDWELVVVDDNGRGSDAQRATEQVVREFGHADRVDYVAHERNQGGGAARNTGIDRARGEFVGFLDDDDTWAPEKLEVQVACFDAAPPSVALVYGHAYVSVDGNTASEPQIKIARSHALDDLMRHNTIGSTSVVLCRRAALVEVGGFDPSLPAKQDVDLYVRVAQRFDLTLVDRPLLTVHRHGAASIGKNINGTIRANELFNDKYRSFIEARPDVHHYRLMALGTLYVAAERYADARRVIGQAWRLRPAHVRALAYWMLASVAPFRVLANRLKRIGDPRDGSMAREYEP